MGWIKLRYRKIGKMIYLNKSLYGTVDAGNLWNEEVYQLLTKLKFTQSKNDPCLFYKISGETRTYICTWVDDFVIAINFYAVSGIICFCGIVIHYFYGSKDAQWIGVGEA